MRYAKGMLDDIRRTIDLRYIRRWRRCQLESLLLALIAVTWAILSLSWWPLTLLLVAAFWYPLPDTSARLWNQADRINCPHCNRPNGWDFWSIKDIHCYLKALPNRSGTFICPFCQHPVQVCDYRHSFWVMAWYRRFSLPLLICSSVALLVTVATKAAWYWPVGAGMVTAAALTAELYHGQRIALSPVGIRVFHPFHLWCELPWQEIKAVRLEQRK